MQVEAKPHPQADLVPVAPGLEGLSPTIIEVEDFNGFDVELRVEARPSEGDRAGRFECAEVRVRQRPSGPPVTSEAIRSVPVAALMKHAPPQVVSHDSDFTEGARTLTWRELTPEIAERLKEQGPTRETLTWVAFVYRLALVTGEPPTKAVETGFGLPRSTAGSWVAIARERGFLGAAEGPGKAGG